MLDKRSDNVHGCDKNNKIETNYGPYLLFCVL